MAHSIWDGPLKVQSKNFPQHTLEVNMEGEVLLGTKGRRFNIISPGLTGDSGTISFKSADRADTYLRHFEYFLAAENQHQARSPDNFAQDATFRVHRGLWTPDYYCFESVNFPGHFIRHCEWRLRISDESQEGNLELFHDDASFRLVDGPYFLQSKNYPEKKFDLEDDYEAWMKNRGDQFYLIRPGLDGTSESVSLSPYSHPDKVLRHFENDLYAEHPCDCRNSYCIAQDASFVVADNRFADGYMALESLNFPGHFVRHCCDRVRIDEDDGSDSFHEDCCFRTVQGPAVIRSYNFPDTGMSFNDEKEAHTSEEVNRFVMVFPGVNKQPGTVSLESYDRPGHFLRHSNYELWLEDRDNCQNADSYMDDATFNLRENVWYDDTVSFESYNFPNHYIRHYCNRLRIDGFDHDDTYKQDASFRFHIDN